MFPQRETVFHISDQASTAIRCRENGMVELVITSSNHTLVIAFANPTDLVAVMLSLRLLDRGLRDLRDAVFRPVRQHGL
ncbi:hypothetical protein GCM10012275_50520 [Longimycelium tulufanense]|uniref:Uncharacterized protein n=1 Tax=Longimycelium tulufanense TaxID=907463 RepID=A0A8J3FWR0_9PSEU|nr:hypothetical protein [Longimycelium tulufanense]GGM73673.1 hypothetical protein GCM10012275_50520 [Longimycelium tulufanense]